MRNPEPTKTTTAAQPAERSQTPILFYDGDCAFCNRSIKWILERDPKAIFRFAPLQGETAARMLPESDVDDLHTVVLVDEEGIHRRSTAALRSVVKLGGAYRFASILLLVPRFIRDSIYKIVAHNRHRLANQVDQCKLPTPEDRRRILP